MKQHLRGAATGRSPDRRIIRGRSELVRARAFLFFPAPFSYNVPDSDEAENNGSRQ